MRPNPGARRQGHDGARPLVPWHWKAAIAGCVLASAAGFTVIQRRRSLHDDLRDLGKRLYTEQSCIVCHGALGHGDGAKAKTLSPPPRDFRARDAYVQGATARDVADTLKSGVVVHPSQMPSFAHLSERERLALGEFIVSLQNRVTVDRE